MFGKLVYTLQRTSIASATPLHAVAVDQIPPSRRASAVTANLTGRHFNIHSVPIYHPSQHRCPRDPQQSTQNLPHTVDVTAKASNDQSPSTTIPETTHRRRRSSPTSSSTDSTLARRGPPNSASAHHFPPISTTSQRWQILYPAGWKYRDYMVTGETEWLIDRRLITTNDVSTTSSAMAKRIPGGLGISRPYSHQRDGTVERSTRNTNQRWVDRHLTRTFRLQLD
jgi:hypothetical protein